MKFVLLGILHNLPDAHLEVDRRVMESYATDAAGERRFLQENVRATALRLRYGVIPR